VENRYKVTRALHLLRSLDQSVVEALSQLDVSVIRRSMAGNTEAQRVGERVLRRLTEHVVKTAGKTLASSEKSSESSWKPPPSSGRTLMSSSLGPSSRGGGSAEKRRSDNVSFRNSQPAQKMPRFDSNRDRARLGYHLPMSSSPRPLFDRPAYMDERRPSEWIGPSGRGGMMRDEYPQYRYRSRPPPYGRYDRGPYY